MKRLVKALGNLAVAASAATALLDLAVSPARPQEPALQQQNPAKVAKDRTVIVREAHLAAVRAAELQEAPAANVQLLDRSMIQQLRPIFQAELRLLSSVAEPTPAQRREIAIEAGRTLEENVQRLANNNAIFRAGQVGLTPDVSRKLVHQHLEIASWSRLSNAQSARYRAEVERKEQARREVVVLNVVATIDKHLCLNARQRDKLCESLRLHWDDRDYPMVETSIDYDQCVAIVPDLYMFEILREDQFNVWRGLPKYHLSSFRTTIPSLSILEIGFEGDDAAVDEDVKAALGGEVRK